MIFSGKSYREIKELLNVSHSFISEWKNQAIFHGVESLKLQYKGTQGYLKACLLYTSPSPRDGLLSRMPSSA